MKAIRLFCCFCMRVIEIQSMDQSMRAVMDQWIDSLPSEFSSWSDLPAGVVLNQPVFQNFVQHFVACFVRDGVLDKYISEKLLPELINGLPTVDLQTWKHICMRHDYSSDLMPTSPHWDRSFVCCPVFRSDRESPLIIKSVWDSCKQAIGLDATQQSRAAIFVLFARRVFHQYPPSWKVMQPWLLKNALAADFDPSARIFHHAFQLWIGGFESVGQFYGRASHWFCPDVNDARDGSEECIGWLADSLSLLQKFWVAIPYLQSVSAVGNVHDRAWAISGILSVLDFSVALILMCFIL